MLILVTAVLTTLFAWGYSAFWLYSERQRAIEAAHLSVSRQVSSIREYSHRLLATADLMLTLTDRYLDGIGNGDPLTDPTLSRIVTDFLQFGLGEIGIRPGRPSGQPLRPAGRAKSGAACPGGRP